MSALAPFARRCAGAGASLPRSKATLRGFSSSARVLAAKNPQILLQDKENGFGFIRNNPRPPKPRKTGVTEIRGPYYSVMGKRYLKDVLET